MVIRSIKDEVAGYDRQRREGFERENGKGRKPDSNEFLSGMFKDQKFCPVITLILYIGTDKPWDAKTQLYDLLEIGEELKPFVTNYKLNLYDYHNHDDFSMFQTENRLLFEILSVSQNKNQMKELIQKRDLRHCSDREVVKAVLGCINIKFNLDKIYDSQKGEYDMCKAIDDLVMEGFLDGREEGQRIGREEGQRIGREEGKTEELMANVTSLMDSLHLTLEEALSLLNVSDDRKSLLFYRK